MTAARRPPQCDRPTPSSAGQPTGTTIHARSSGAKPPIGSSTTSPVLSTVFLTQDTRRLSFATRCRWCRNGGGVCFARLDVATHYDADGAIDANEYSYAVNDYSAGLLCYDQLVEIVRAETGSG